jgi:hypothetical protein
LLTSILPWKLFCCLSVVITVQCHSWL